MPVTRSILLRAGLVVLLALGVLWVTRFEVTVCPLANLTGYPCPGCGLTRAGLALLSGDLGTALRLHPLSIVCVPLVGLVVTDGAYRFVLQRAESPLSPLFSRWSARLEGIWWVLGALLIGIWIARFFGVFGGPVEVSGVLPRLFRE